MAILVEACITQLHRFCIAAPPRSTGLVCSSTNRCSLKRDRLVVCVPQVQVISNVKHAGFRPSIDSFAQYSLAPKKSSHPFHSILLIHCIPFIHSIFFIDEHSYFDSSLLQGYPAQPGSSRLPIITGLVCPGSPGSSVCPRSPDL